MPSCINRSVSGSAYTYSYVSFGEIFAWIIGWDLLMEYAMAYCGGYLMESIFCTGVGGFGIHIPDWMTMDYLLHIVVLLMQQLHCSNGTAFNSLDGGLQRTYNAWQHAPMLGNFHPHHEYIPAS